MDSLLIALLGVALATNQPAALSNLVQQSTGLTVAVPDPNDPVEREYQKLLADDDTATEEADRLIKNSERFEAAGAGNSPVTLKLRLEQHFKPVRDRYEGFLRRHPDHARARLAFGGFLDSLGEEEEARQQWEKASELEPRNPATWNNLANYYGHRGPVKKAFEYYGKAIELKPDEATYCWNLATTVYLFRRDAMEFYQIDEPKVFDKSLDLYRKALSLAPNNFELATDLAQTYYGIKPIRIEEALAAWTYARKIARDDFERQGIDLHFARLELNHGRLEAARKHLDEVTDPRYDGLKQRLERNLAKKQKGTVPDEDPETPETSSAAGARPSTQPAEAPKP